MFWGKGAIEVDWLFWGVFGLSRGKPCGFSGESPVLARSMRVRKMIAEGEFQHSRERIGGHAENRQQSQRRSHGIDARRTGPPA